MKMIQTVQEFEQAKEELHEAIQDNLKIDTPRSAIDLLVLEAKLEILEALTPLIEACTGSGYSDKQESDYGDEL